MVRCIRNEALKRCCWIGSGSDGGVWCCKVLPHPLHQINCCALLTQHDPIGHLFIDGQIYALHPDNMQRCQVCRGW